MSSVTEADVRAAIAGSLAPALSQAGIEPEALPPDLDLIERGILDSLGLLELIAELEERFGLELDFEGVEPDELTRVGGLSAEVVAQSGAATPPAA